MRALKIGFGCCVVLVVILGYQLFVLVGQIKGVQAAATSQVAQQYAPESTERLVLDLYSDCQLHSKEVSCRSRKALVERLGGEQEQAMALVTLDRVLVEVGQVADAKALDEIVPSWPLAPLLDWFGLWAVKSP